MSAQTQPSALPPKLKQLLETLPDVDKVKLLTLAHHYKMDLDDPGFLPLLLTGQGIEALEKSRAALADEMEKTLDLMASRISAAGQHEEKRLGIYCDKLAGFVQQRAAEAEAGMKQALSAWADRSLAEALDKAITSRAEAATATATATARQATESFSITCSRAAAEAQQAAEAATEAAREARAAIGEGRVGWLAAAFVFGCFLGVVMPAFFRHLLT